MFEIRTYLEQHSYDYTDPYYFNNPEAKYISLDDPHVLREYFDHRKFTPNHIQMLVMIKYEGKDIVAMNAPNGLDLWKDYIQAIETYLINGKADVMYGIDPILLKFESVGRNLVEFSILDEIYIAELDGMEPINNIQVPVKVYANAILPENEFFKALLDGAEHFWNILKDNMVFEEKELHEYTPKNLPEIIIGEIQLLRKKLKNI